ncbi:hypothetical protein V8E52_000487 [Russula decolorans]
MSVAVDEAAEDTLNSLERLILAQAVYELGSDAWTNVSSILSQHPLILQFKRNNAIFSPSACQNIYHDLLRVVGLDRWLSTMFLNTFVAHSNNLKLAQRMYQARVLELKQLILAEEARFNSVASEIEAIRAGKWDVKIEKDLEVDETTPDRPSPSQSPQSEVCPSISSTSQELNCSDGAVSAEPDHSSIAEPPEIAEVHEDQLVEPSEVVERSEAEVELESDGRAPVSNSNPMEGETSTEDRSDMAWKDDVSMRHISEPPVDHAVKPPQSLEDTTISVTNTLKTDTPKTEPEGSEAESHLADATGTVEVKQEMQPDEGQPEEIQVKQDDEMDIEQKNVSRAASPVAEMSHSARDRKKTREDSQPVDEDEPGPARRRGRPPTADSQTSKKFQTVITMVHSQISQHRNGNIFHNPIKTSEAPDYYDIVKRPMDLKTIKSRIREGQITSSDEFQREVYLMFANSLMYNRPGSDIFNMAEEMMLESETQINTFRQTEGIIKGSHR